MRKTLLFSLILSLTSFWLIGCGGGGNNLSGTKDQPSISISPMNPNILVGQNMQFTANIQNLSDTRVAWSVQEEKGGTIASTDTGGMYTAPWPTGIYHVVATAVADPSLTTNTMVSVTAKFAFIEELPTGDAVPFSMTPMLGTVGTDGSIGIGGVIDQGTGKPVSVAMSSLTLSNDGTKAALDVATQVTSGTSTYTYDVYIANADGTGDATQLTFDGASSWMWPQFSSDGKQILYMKNGDIWIMNADGSDQHELFSSEVWGGDLYSATLSPDGTKIAAELDWAPNGVWQDGIVIMNADGTNPIPLTGANLGCTGWDEMPAFTNDGTKIMFSEYCYNEAMNTSYESLYTVTTDGTRAALLGGDVGIIHYNPLPAGDRIVFQSNQATPGNFSFEIYTMKADGTGMTQLTSNTVFDGFDGWLWGYASASASAQQALAKSHHGAAARAEKIKHLQQRRR